MEHKQFATSGGAIHYWVSSIGVDKRWIVFFFAGTKCGSSFI